MSGKRYLEEFKIEAVKQVVDRGHSVASVATRLGVTTKNQWGQTKSMKSIESDPIDLFGGTWSIGNIFDALRLSKEPCQ